MRVALLFLLALAWRGANAAGEAADYVQTPQVVAGEREFDFKAGTARNSDGTSVAALSGGFGYGVNDLWFTEAYVKYQRQTPEHLRFDALEWENKLQLTEAGKYPLDLGLLLEIEAPRDRSEGYPCALALLMQADVRRWQFNANLSLQRSFRNDIPGATEFAYQWQTQYRWRPELQFGLQGFGELGPWDHWNDSGEQTHRLGPAAFGKLALGSGRAIRYNAAWLIGVAHGAPANTARLQIEYEF